jgi:hypothetical protein
MTQINRARSHRTPANRSGARRPAAPSGRRPTAHLVADGVVAAYVHDLSRRPRRSAQNG